MINREQIAAEYMEWVNDYGSVALFAEHRGLTLEEGMLLLQLAKSCFNNPHPEA